MINSTFYVYYDSIVFLRYLIVPCQSIMLFFFLEMLSETTAAYFASMIVSDHFQVSFGIVALALAGPLIPMILGFIPGCRKSPHYNNSIVAQYLFGTVSGVSAIVARIITSFVPNPAKLYFGASSLFFFGIYWPTCLQNGGFSPNKNAEQEGKSMGMSFAISILLVLVFKSCQSSIDVLLYPVSGAFAVTFIMSILPMALYCYLFWINVLCPDMQAVLENDHKDHSDAYCPSLAYCSKRRYEGQAREWELNKIPWSIYGIFSAFFLSCGLMCNLTFMYHFICNASAVSRWADWGPYFGYLIIPLVEYAGFVLMCVAEWKFGLFHTLRPIILIGLNLILFILMPIIASQSQTDGVLAIIATNMLLFVLVLLSFTFILNFQMMWYDIVRNKRSISLVSLGFLVGMVLFICFNVFIGGSVFYEGSTQNLRNLYWLAVLLITFFATFPVLFIQFKSYQFGDPLKRPDQRNQEMPNLQRSLSAFIAISTAAVFVSSIIGYLVTSRTGASINYSSAPENMTICTLNIQNGYDLTANRNYLNIMNFIQNNSFDLIALQESDGAKITNGGDDILRYLSDNLQMFSYYGPGPTRGSNGISLLSRYPINKAEYKSFHNTTGQQTYYITSKVVLGQNQYTVIATQFNKHMDDQVSNANELLLVTHNVVPDNVTGMPTFVPKDTDPIIVIGDFVFTPGSAAWSVLSQVYADTYAQVNNTLPGYTTPYMLPKRRTDFVFIFPRQYTEFAVQYAYPIYNINPIGNHYPLYVKMILNSTCIAC
jgi:endonuclease/exonuclease/phosphatase family metal-dependent hydrolase